MVFPSHGVAKYFRLKFWLYSSLDVVVATAGGTSITHHINRVYRILTVSSHSHSQCGGGWIVDVCISCWCLHRLFLHSPDTHLCWSSNCSCLCHRDSYSCVCWCSAFCHRFELLIPLMQGFWSSQFLFHQCWLVVLSWEKWIETIWSLIMVQYTVNLCNPKSRYHGIILHCFLAGWIAFAWVVWQGVKSSMHIAKNSLALTGEAISTMSGSAQPQVITLEEHTKY